MSTGVASGLSPHPLEDVVSVGNRQHIVSKLKKYKKKTHAQHHERASPFSLVTLKIDPVMAVLVTIRLVGRKVWDGEGWVIRCCGEAGKCKNRDGLHDGDEGIDGARTRRSRRKPSSTCSLPLELQSLAAEKDCIPV